MYHWIVDISNDNQNAQFHLTQDNPKCIFAHRDESSKETPAEATLYIDQNELMIERVGNTPIVLERGSRSRTLQPSHPTRVLPQDIIRIGESVFHVDRIQQDCQPKRKFSQLRQMTNKAMLAGAAAMMTVIPACRPEELPDNNQRTAGVVVPSTDGSPCENGKVMCLDNTRYECENHQWKYIEYCQSPSLCEYQFDNSNNPVSTSCTNTKPCKEGEYICMGATLLCEREPGWMCNRNDEMYQCKDGRWDLVRRCPYDQTCVLEKKWNNNVTAKCVHFTERMGSIDPDENCHDGQMKCDSGNARAFCHWGGWMYNDVCRDGEVCVSFSDRDVRCEPEQSADSNATESACENGKRMCLTNNRYECENHQWKLIEKCQKPAFCKYDDASSTTSCTKTEPCKDGEYTCFGSSIRCEQEPGFNCGRNDEMYQCKDGHWQLVTTCPENQTCRIQDDATAKCVAFPRAMGTPKFVNECKDGEMKCESGTRMFCHWGRWKYKDVCRDGEVCVSFSDRDVRCEPEQSAGVKREK